MVQWWKLPLMALTVLAATGLADMVFSWTRRDVTNYFPNGYGGLLGAHLYSQMMAQPLGHVGSVVVFSLVYVVGLVLIFTEDPGQSLEWWQFFAGMDLTGAINNAPLNAKNKNPPEPPLKSPHVPLRLRILMWWPSPWSLRPKLRLKSRRQPRNLKAKASALVKPAENP